MKTILVSGTSSGIGYEICIQALKLKYKVISVSRNSKPFENIKGIECYSVDITDNDQLNNLVEDLKNKKVNIDFLINNAGHLKNETFDKTSYESFKETYDVNVFGLAQITRLLLPIINQPNSAILSIGAIIQKPIVKNSEIVVGNTMKLTLACDHRTVDGATGSLFLKTLKDYIENPVSILI